jgi:hypothetical protein
MIPENIPVILETTIEGDNIDTEHRGTNEDLFRRVLFFWNHFGTKTQEWAIAGDLDALVSY